MVKNVSVQFIASYLSIQTNLLPQLSVFAICINSLSYLLRHKESANLFQKSLNSILRAAKMDWLKSTPKLHWHGQF
jgi:hypothetical protein